MSTSPPTGGKILPITRWGTPILHSPVRILTSPDFNTAHLETLVANMFATMYAAHGCGLAANQIGVNLKVIVYDLTVEGKRSWGVVCNPSVEVADDPVQSSGTTDEPPRTTFTNVEGCLSYPGLMAPVSRPRSIKVRGVDQKGSLVEISATDLLASVLQHEADHLEGVVYGDHVPREVRQKMDSKYDELQTMKAYPDDWPVSRADHVW